ncbi:MAG: hypothetical protein A3J93_04855 [Candidatus Magasanikbacteria bacterium RIFOXYC2_FULL_42_28]|uniref:Methyltransferase domain-containing protein n=1 Tax=Candidatus Magasanikbacteria bacterium RIFOXYC2_FULL_42_28 TaxID=1798704 RepID=A0A1F6NXH2_9BACT|nr:MAG: hypothetical protein A3J93_04855 [Candidatus Magasanikbacteria bacterium RIFOXYC2_FULL_42_28]
MKKSQFTTIKPTELNYEKYATEKYDDEIKKVIPGYKKIHQTIYQYTRKINKKTTSHVLDLGCGTGITSAVIRRALPTAYFDLIDFSRQMLSGAKRKLGKNRVRYYLGDLALFKPKIKYDITTTVIGLHHQNDRGKQKIFKMTYNNLNGGGIFIYSDLMTYQNLNTAAYNSARHISHLTKNSKSKKMLTEWAYHHLYLNKLTTVEQQISWLKKTGFKIIKRQDFFNTVLLICRK